MNAEMRLLALVDRESSGTGRIVKATFELHADEAEGLRGKTGKRFGAALVEIGDDEKAVEKKPRVNHWTKRAGMLCEDGRFHGFLKDKYPTSWGANGGNANEKAAIILRTFCGVQSRADLATNPKAAAIFDRILAEFEMWKRGE
jgi:hypothetical protein